MRTGTPHPFTDPIDNNFTLQGRAGMFSASAKRKVLELSTPPPVHYHGKYRSSYGISVADGPEAGSPIK